MRPITDKGARVVLVVHDLISLNELSGRYRLTFNQKFRTALEHAIKLIFVSAATMDQFDSRFPDYAATLYSSVFSPVIQLDLQAAATTVSATPKPERPKFVSILSDEPRKNIALLIEAFARMSSRTELTIRGSIPASHFPTAHPNIHFIKQATKN